MHNLITITRLALSTTIVLLNLSVSAQHEHLCASQKRHAVARQLQLAQRAQNTNSLISHEYKYDMKFVHLNLNLERTTKYVSGNAKTVARVSAAALDTFMTLLHENLVIDSIYFNNVNVPFTRADSMVKVKVQPALPANATFTAVVYYKGLPPNGGAAIGSGFSNGTSGAWNMQCTWSLSESFVAYHWWPCKQALTDKIDSSWVFVTTDSTNKVGSNGLLKNVVTIGNKKRYEWKSRTPIDYYLISVAVSKYREYKLYAKPQYLVNDSILIQNYIYTTAFTNNNWINTQKTELDQMPEVLEFLCDMYGMYPFYKEKYGHSMAPFSGGMEHQTMTSLGFFDYYVDAHELGHQWWGDNVTCKTWADIWINEGFASYTEHLTAQYLDPPSFMPNLNAAHLSVMSQPGGSVFFTGADTLNSNVIFDSRLTYDKGGAIIRSLQFLTNNDSLWFNTLRGFQNTYKNSTASVVDFKNYYDAQTGINSTQFFSQWYYGQGYPTFSVSYNTIGNTLMLKSTQQVSMPSVTPLFITPVEYKITRAGAPDTLVRVVHSTTTEVYYFALTGTVTGIVCDPNNWIINKALGPFVDPSIAAGLEPGAVVTDEFQAWPNPVNQFLHLRPASASTVKLYDLQGRLVAERVVRGGQVDVSALEPAVYLIQVYDGEGTELGQAKVIKH